MVDELFIHAAINTIALLTITQCSSFRSSFVLGLTSVLDSSGYQTLVGVVESVRLRTNLYEKRRNSIKETSYFL